MRITVALSVFLGMLSILCDAGVRPIPIRVVIVTAFELGADTGDAPGELQYWVERNHLNEIISFPYASHPLRMNRNGVLAVVTGMGAAKAAATIMALGLDSRFDVRQAYWMVAGIAGVDPGDASLASAAWAEWVVGGDLGYEVDAREIPPDWTTGFVPFGKSKPYELPVSNDVAAVFHLNSSLAALAFGLTEHVDLGDSPDMQKERARYAAANARRPPFVLRGDIISTSTFFIGVKMSQRANAWMSYFTGGKGNYTMAAMEDTGTLSSLQALAHGGRVDWNRVMVLRSASNYDQPPSGVSAADALARNARGEWPGYLPALESGWRAGNRLVQEITMHWSKYQDTVISSRADAH